MDKRPRIPREMRCAMGKLYMLLGKSASGKDSIAKELLKKYAGRLSPVIPYTTRPIRIGEKPGVAYRFVSEDKMAELEAAGKVLERRDYVTIHGPWSYFTADDGQIDLARKDSLMVGTPEAFAGLAKTLGRENLVPILVALDDEERLMRAIWREKKQVKPNYAEVCRRYLADEKDFAPEVLEAKLGDDVVTFYNWDFDACMEQATAYFDNVLG